LTGKRAQKASEFDAMIQKVTETGDSVQQAYNLTLTETADALAARLEEKIAALDQLQFSSSAREAESGGSALAVFAPCFERREFESAIALAKRFPRLSSNDSHRPPCARGTNGSNAEQQWLKRPSWRHVNSPPNR
jgi:hypothetical protein